jgi:hypothetical protein
MIRKLLRTLVLALAAVATVTTMAEAATKRVVHHRTRHSTRVSAGTTSARKNTAHHRAHHSAKRKNSPSTKPR